MKEVNEFYPFSFLPGFVSSCPMNCSMCYYKYKNSPLDKSRIMKFATWKRFLQRMAKENFHVGQFNLSFWGEAPLHPQYLKFLAYAAKINKRYDVYKYSDLFTSGVFFSKKMIDSILLLCKESGLKLNRIVFGLDAFSEETYNKIRVNGNFKKVVSNIQYFISKREELNIKGPKAAIEFLYQSKNRHELKDFIDYWKKFFIIQNLPLGISYDFFDWRKDNSDFIFVKRADVPDLKEQKLLTDLHKKDLLKLGIINEVTSQNKKIQKNDRFEQKTKKISRKPCPALWQQLAMNYNGDFAPCCSDYNFVNNLGNIHKNTLKEIWQGERITKLRLAHLIGYFQYSSICENCRNQDGAQVEKDFYIRYLKHIKRDDVIPLFEKRWETTGDT